MLQRIHQGFRTARRLPPEAAIWTAALVALACTDPRAEGLLSLCVLKATGLPFCPGCGLGHSIAFLLEGQWTAAMQAHPLGPVALPVLVGRIARLCATAREPCATVNE